MESFLYGLLSAATLAFCGLLYRQSMRLGKEFKELKTSQRNQIKTSIVQTYEKASERGYITPLELETINRLNDSYEQLGGNTYVKALVNRMNCDVEIKGDPVPEHT